MYRAAVIGDRDSIYGFSALGLDVNIVEHGEDARPIFKKLSTGEYAIIFITEYLAEELSEEIEKLSENPTPAVIPIPGVTGNTGCGIKAVKSSVEKAVGSDIIFND